MVETRLRQERLKRSESTYQLAEKVGVSQSHYFRVEIGETGATPDMAEKLAAHFGVSVRYLFSPLRYMPEPAVEEAGA